MADQIFANATATVSGTVVTAPWLNDVNTAVYVKLSAVAGVNALTATGPSGMSAYTPNQVFYLIPVAANTTAATININGLGVKSLTKNGGVPLLSGDLAVGVTYELSYDGTKFQLLNPIYAAFGANSDITSLSGLTTPLSVAQGGAAPVFQCRTDLISSSIIRLSRVGGSYIFIGGFLRQIPTAGVDLPPTGLNASTMYNLYAFWTGSAIQLEASTTGRAVDATYGHPIKSGDSTRTLVGKGYIQSGIVWDTTVNNALLHISYWNRRKRSVQQYLVSTTGSLSNLSFLPVVGLGIPIASWGEEYLDANAQIIQNIATSGAVVFASVGLQNSTNTVIGIPGSFYFQAPSVGAYGTTSAYVPLLITETLGLSTAGAAYYQIGIQAFINITGSYQIIAGTATSASIMG